MQTDSSTSWHGREVAITGGTGFIGSSLAEALVVRGANVRVLSHYRGEPSKGVYDLIPDEHRREIKLLAGDIQDGDWVREALRETSHVFHLAALVGIPFSYKNPRQVVDTNLGGTLNVLEAARHNDVQMLVHTSTSEVYGSARIIPMTEGHPVSAQSPYAASKIGADHLALSYQRSFDLPVAIARPFNTYGPGQSARAVVPTIISQALVGGAVRLGSTFPTRDLNFVEDTVEGFLAIASSPSTIGEVFNIATGVETSIGEVARMVGEIIGEPIEIVSDDDRVRPPLSEVSRLVGDSSKLTSASGWLPAVSIYDGLGRTIEWIRTNIDRFDTSLYGV